LPVTIRLWRLWKQLRYGSVGWCNLLSAAADAAAADAVAAAADAAADRVAT